VPPTERVQLGAGDGCKLLATGPFSALELQLKSALIAGAVLSSPVWLYQLWAFVTPALYSKERKYAIIFVSCGGVLFALGAVLAYVVIREGLTVLLGFGGDATIAALSPDSYFSFLIAMLIIFGVSFELPLLLIMLNQIGMVSGAKLAKWRRYSIFGMVVFAGVVVPGNDPITMGALAIALCLLYEVSVQVTRIHDKRKAKRLAADGLSELSDDEASALPDAVARRAWRNRWPQQARCPTRCHCLNRCPGRRLRTSATQPEPLPGRRLRTSATQPEARRRSRRSAYPRPTRSLRRFPAGPVPRSRSGPAEGPARWTACSSPPPPR